MIVYGWISNLSLNGALGWYDILYATLRASLLLAAALLVTRYWTRGSAAQRYLVLSVTFLATLLVPVVQAVAPQWNVPVLPSSVVVADQSLISYLTGATPVEAIVPALPAPLQADLGAVAHDVGHQATQPLWVTIGMAIWLMGVLVVLVGLYRSHRYVRKIIRSTKPVTHLKVLNMLERVTQRLGYTRPISVRYHDIRIPIAYGRKAPVILLPLEAESWDRDRLHDVLVHECAHLKREDSVVQYMVAVACALYWFSPFVWIAARQLRNEREQACDDYVITLGRKPSDYATLLLDFTDQLSLTKGVVAPMLAFTSTKSIYRRLYAIIDPNRKRGKSTWTYRVALSTVIAGTTLTVSAFSPTAREESSPSLLRVDSSYSMQNLRASGADSSSKKDSSKSSSPAKDGKVASSQLSDSAVARATRIPAGALLVVDGIPASQDALRPRTSSVTALSWRFLKSEEAVKKYGPAAKEGAIELTTRSVADESTTPWLGDVKELLNGTAPDGTKDGSTGKLKRLSK